LILSSIILVIATNVLVPRAFVPARNIVLQLFQRADRFFNELNKSTTGGIVLVPDRETLPLFQPITWRETRKKSLGTFRYQFRILMLLLAPLILIIAAVMGDSRAEFTSPFHAFPAFFWSVSVICLTIHSTGVMPAERINQSLDVLLVAPLTPAEIVIQKLSGVRRLIKVLSIPFAVLILFQAIWTGYVHQGESSERSANLGLELVVASLTVLIYMPIIMWTGFQFGLRLKTQMQAVLSTFATIAIVCMVPNIVVRAQDDYGFASQIFEIAFMVGLSPLQVIFGVGQLAHGIDGWNRNGISVFGGTGDAWLMLGVHFAFYGAVWWWLRRNALRTFSKVVRRMEPDHGSRPK